MQDSNAIENTRLLNIPNISEIRASINKYVKLAVSDLSAKGVKSIFSDHELRFPSEKDSKLIIETWSSIMKLVESDIELDDNGKTIIRSYSVEMLRMIVNELICDTNVYSKLYDIGPREVLIPQEITMNNICGKIIRIVTNLNTFTTCNHKQTALVDLSSVCGLLLHWENDGINYSEISKFGNGKKCWLINLL